MPSTLHIEYTDYIHKQQIVVLNSNDRDEWVIGRRDSGFTPAINLSWVHSVAHRHARLTYQYGTWYIEALSSTSPTKVNDRTLVLGVPVELASKAIITVGNFTLKASFADGENMPEGSITPASSRESEASNAVGLETRTIEIMTRLKPILAKPASNLFDSLLEIIRSYFPTASSSGIALYRDKEPYLPASYPPGTAQISFRLVRRALDTQQTIQWDRASASTESQNISSLNDVIQALYAPIFRGVKKLGVICLHTRTYFSDDDYAMLTAITELLSADEQFQPESAALRLPSVFVSYSHKNIHFVKKLVDDLRRQRVTVWFDERLRSGKDWQAQLIQAIHAADAFALVMSPDSLKSEWVRWEVDQARKANKPIFPLWYEACETIPIELAANQRIDILADYQHGLLELTDELYELSGEKDSVKVFEDAPAGRSIGKKEKVRILFLAANPRDTNLLRLSEEIRTIQERIRGGKYRDQFDIIQQGWAARFSDLQQHLLEYKPHIVHFSGHGTSNGQLILEDNTGNSQLVDPKALRLLFTALKDPDTPSEEVQLVVLNACFSSLQAQAIVDTVGCVSGMSRAVSDRAAIEFAGAFYNALTFGKSVQIAFNVATAAMVLTGEEETPQLLTVNVDANKLIFCHEDKV